MTEGMTDVGRYISSINNTPSKERKWKRAALRYVREGKIRDAKTVIALLLVAEKR